MPTHSQFTHVTSQATHYTSSVKMVPSYRLCKTRRPKKFAHKNLVFYARNEGVSTLHINTGAQAITGMEMLS